MVCHSWTREQVDARYKSVDSLKLSNERHSFALEGTSLRAGHGIVKGFRNEDLLPRYC